MQATSRVGMGYKPIGEGVEGGQETSRENLANLQAKSKARGRRGSRKSANAVSRRVGGGSSSVQGVGKACNTKLARLDDGCR